MVRQPSFNSAWISSFLKPGRSMSITYRPSTSLISVFMTLEAFFPYSGLRFPKNSSLKESIISSNKFSPKILGISINHSSILYVNLLLVTNKFLEPEAAGTRPDV